MGVSDGIMGVFWVQERLKLSDVPRWDPKAHSIATSPVQQLTETLSPLSRGDVTQ